MSVLNIHERTLPAKAQDVGSLLDSLAGPDDQLWPVERWPAMRLDRGLAVGSRGGHGLVSYTVVAYVPGQWVRFAFDGPRGFQGFHEFTVHADGDDRTVLRHTLAMRARGQTRLTWPLMYRWSHDAVLEDSLDRVERALTGTVARPARWSRYVRFIRLVRRLMTPSRQKPARRDA
ncbi:SRPBCC family protein [Streptomyces sp. NPDC054864]